jgi:NifB/MoaA-like Fe-S oxidoreductase
MLKHGESVFLDDLTLETVINQLGVPIYPVLGVEELIKTCLTLNPLNKS